MDEHRVARAVRRLDVDVRLDHRPLRICSLGAGADRDAGGDRHPHEVAPRDVVGFLLWVLLVCHGVILRERQWTRAYLAVASGEGGVQYMASDCIA
jgi:hypothetical protein